MGSFIDVKKQAKTLDGRYNQWLDSVGGALIDANK
jgi:hypothetical protein